VRRTLEDFKLPDDCLGPPVRHVTLYSPSRRALKLESPHDEFRVGRMARLYLHLLDECLRLGVEWLPCARYLASTPARNGSIIRYEIGGRLEQARVRFIIGADGTMSQVARDLSLDTNRQWIVGVEDVYRGVSSGGPARFHCFLDPVLAPGYLGWVVDDGEEIHVGVGGYAHRFEPSSALEAFGKSIQNVVDLRKASRVERRGGRIPVGGVHKRIANRRGLVVGDAAGAPSPLTAGGLDPCLRLSAFAAGVVGDYLRTSNETALADYSGRRFRTRFISRLWMRRMLAAVREPTLMEFACAILRLPGMRSIAWNVFFGRGSFPDVEVALPAWQEI